MEPERTLTQLAGACGDLDDCPAVHLSKHGTLVFQGPDATNTEGIRLGSGELAVELPVELVKEAIRAYDHR